MCGGAIISEFIPQRDAARGKRGLCAEDLWPHAATAAADFAAASFHPDQGNTHVHLHACYL
jgi:EREBP-like factor